MSAEKNRVRLGVERLEDRCTPSAMGGGLSTLVPASQGEPLAAAHVRNAHEHAIPIKVIEQCSADISAGTASTSGFATHLGRFTGEGSLESTNVDPAADQGSYKASVTIVTARGDKLFVSVATTWQLSTGEGTETITVKGGTGRYAGASGDATLDSTITQDPESPTTFHCQSKGSGTLILADR